MGPEPGWSFVAGLDLGIKHDHSALAVVGYRQDSQDLRLAYAESWAPNPKTRQVDLIKVEDTVLAMHKRFDFVTVGFDPYAAQLMAQRLQRQHVPMEEVAFVGANLNKMASTLLDVFRSRRLRMYPCRKLIADLGRLTIAERSYGYKLEAVHDEHGHADLATALAIALPIAIEQCDRPQVVLGAGWQCLTAQDEYESPLDAFARRVADAYRRDREDLERSRGNEDEAMLMPSHPGAFVKPSGPRDAPRPSPFDFPTFQQ
jgi:phage terminase large subunit-like protein